MLGMAVRSVQLMVDRNELQAWKTPGGTGVFRAAQWSSGCARAPADRCLWPMHSFQRPQRMNLSGTRLCRPRSVRMGECRRLAI